MNFLSSESLQGRGNYTPELLIAAEFISNEFEKDSLIPFPAFNSFIQPFSPNGRIKKKWMDSAGNYDPSKVLMNVVGMIEGRSLPDEVIIFSAHFDHLEPGKKKKGRDHVYNGANDNASGTTAILTLADYFSKRKFNERTLIFCAFSGEELGLYGSRIFSQFISSKVVKAVINIEMIGMTSAAGKKSFFVTGSEYSDLDEILKKNLEGRDFKIVEEPDKEKMLFHRSDNLPFALYGIPAHTIMCSADEDPCYHKPCDEAERLDLENMTIVINAIITATRSLVDGTDTPERIDENFESIF